MTKVFLSGSRHISKLSDRIKERIDRIVAEGFPIVVGDANGADKAFQHYLLNRSYSNVEVFFSGRSCRNNAGNWPLREVEPPKGSRGYEVHSAKDREMAHEATIGLMVWDGKSAGTILNVRRVIRQGKIAVLYVAPNERFIAMKTPAHWDALMAMLDPDVRQKVEMRMAAEEPEPSFSLLPAENAPDDSAILL